MSRYEVPQPIVISGETIEQIFRMDNGMEGVESAFREHGEGRARMPAKIYLDLPEMNGDFRAMPAYLPGMGASGWTRMAMSWTGLMKRSFPQITPVMMIGRRISATTKSGNCWRRCSRKTRRMSPSSWIAASPAAAPGDD